MTPLSRLDIGRWLAPERVIRFPAGTPRRNAVMELATVTVHGWELERQQAFIQAIIDRENVATTAIGGGAAIPHARLAGLPEARISLGLCPEGLEWTGPDHQPVRIMTLIATRDEDHAEHLRILAALAGRLRDAIRIQRTIAATDPLQAIALLANG